MAGRITSFSGRGKAYAWKVRAARRIGMEAGGVTDPCPCSAPPSRASATRVMMPSNTTKSRNQVPCFREPDRREARRPPCAARGGTGWANAVWLSFVLRSGVWCLLLIVPHRCLCRNASRVLLAILPRFASSSAPFRHARTRRMGPNHRRL
jgi:hypothetical protein